MLLLSKLQSWSIYGSAHIGTLVVVSKWNWELQRKLQPIKSPGFTHTCLTGQSQP